MQDIPFPAARPLITTARIPTARIQTARPHLDAQRAALDAAIKRFAAQDETARQARRNETAARLLAPRPPATRRRPIDDHFAARDEGTLNVPAKAKPTGRRMPPTRPDMPK